MLDTTRVDYRRRHRLHELAIEHLQAGLGPADWQHIARSNLTLVRAAIRGDRGLDVVDHWAALIAAGDLDAISEACLPHTEEADLMRVASPFAGLLPEHVRRSVLHSIPRTDPATEAHA